MGTESKLNLAQRMLLIAAGADPLTKDVEVGFGNNKHKGISYAMVVNTVRNLCAEHGVLVIATVADFHEQEVTYNSGGTAYKLTVRMETSFINAENMEERLTIVTIGQGVDSGDKASGKAMTYARKHALSAAFMLATGDQEEEQVEPYRREAHGSVRNAGTGKSKRQQDKKRSQGDGQKGAPPPLPTERDMEEARGRLGAIYGPWAVTEAGQGSFEEAVVKGGPKTPADYEWCLKALTMLTKAFSPTDVSAVFRALDEGTDLQLDSPAAITKSVNKVTGGAPVEA